MTKTFTPGQKVTYMFYGQREECKVAKVGKSGKILLLTNGKWMHSISCSPIDAKAKGTK